MEVVSAFYKGVVSYSFFRADTGKFHVFQLTVANRFTIQVFFNSRSG